MNKITKASIATGAAVLLLLGGGGTLAYWNAGTTAGAASITSGVLTVAPVGSPVVTDQDGNAITLAVPGDTITVTQDVTITATGDNLKFEVALADGALTGAPDLLAELTADADYSITSGVGSLTRNGSTDEWSVATAGTSTATITVTIEWPFGDEVDNGSQGKSVAVAATGFTLTQIAALTTTP